MHQVFRDRGKSSGLNIMREVPGICLHVQSTGCHIHLNMDSPGTSSLLWEEYSSTLYKGTYNGILTLPEVWWLGSSSLSFERCHQLIRECRSPGCEQKSIVEGSVHRMVPLQSKRKRMNRSQSPCKMKFKGCIVIVSPGEETLVSTFGSKACLILFKRKSTLFRSSWNLFERKLASTASLLNPPRPWRILLFKWLCRSSDGKHVENCLLHLEKVKTEVALPWRLN